MEKKINLVAAILTIISFVSSFFNIYFLLIGMILFAFTFSKIILSWNNKYEHLYYRYIRYFFTSDGLYILDSKNITYQFLDRTNMIHKKTYMIRSCTNGLMSFSDRYWWTKNCKCVVKSLYENLQVSNGWTDHGMPFYTINFDRKYKKNEIIKAGILIDSLKDKNKESKLFLSTGIYEKTKQLRMIIKFDKSLEPIDIKLRIFKDYINGPPIAEKILEFDYKNYQICFSHKYPLLGCQYLILWKFKE